MEKKFIIIGGIAFQRNEVISYTSTPIQNSNVNANKYAVTTKHGTFDYNDTTKKNNGYIVFDGAKVTITDCRLTGLTGTDAKDNYVLEHSTIFSLNLSGDSENVDQVVLQDHSSIQRLKKDESDVIVDMNPAKEHLSR